MAAIAIAVLSSFVVVVTATLLLRPLAGRLGLVDQPGGRKHHEQPTPMVGGLAMMLGIVIAIPLVPGLDSRSTPYLLGIVLLALAGALDDRFDVRASVRTLSQVLATLVVILSNDLMIRTLGSPFFGDPIGLGPFAVPFTVVVVITVINAFNMMDGLDGLAAGMALAALAPIWLICVVGGNWPLIGGVSVVIAAILAFLLFNLPLPVNRRWKVFMGDAGSMLLGFLVAFSGMRISQGEAAAITPVAALWFAALPVHDLLATTVRRIIKRQPFWTPDRDHLHHVLLWVGFSAGQAGSILLAIQALYSLVGLSGWYLGVPDGVLFTAWSLLAVGHFALIRRSWVLAGWLKRILGRQPTPA